MSSEIAVNGMVLDDRFVEFLRQHDRYIRFDRSVLEDGFGVDCVNFQHWRLNFLAGLAAEDWLLDPEIYRGEKSGDLKPGDIDVTRSVYIGETDSDLPIAIDYRTSPPSVVAAVWGVHSYMWTVIAADVGEFVAVLRRALPSDAEGARGGLPG